MLSFTHRAPLSRPPCSLLHNCVIHRLENGHSFHCILREHEEVLDKEKIPEALWRRHQKQKEAEGQKAGSERAPPPPRPSEDKTNSKASVEHGVAC